MGRILDTITTFKDNLTGGSFEALTIASGDSLQLRFLDPNGRIELLEAWAGNNASKMDVSIRSPLLHDNVRGIRFAYMFNPTLNVADGNPQLFMSPYETQRYRPSDTLICEASGTAGDDVTFTQLVLYEGVDVPDGKFISYTDLRARAVNLVGIRISPSPPGATSTYGTAEAINSDDARLKANTMYAWIGATFDLPCTTLAITAPEFGNFRVSMPGSWNTQIASGWFLELSRRFNEPLIPVFNSNNAGNIMSQVADVGGGSNPLISLKLVELSGTGP